MKFGIYFVAIALSLALGCKKDEESSSSSGGESTSSPSKAVAPLGSGSIKGQVKWSGSVPKLASIKMNAECASRYKGKGGPKSQSLMLGSGNSLANVIVTVKGGLPSGPYPQKPAAMRVDQRDCNYDPHVIAVQTKQEVVFLNSDGILHNVHALPKKNRQFNLSMPASMKESKPKKFRKVEAPFKVKCDVHPWMLSYVAVFDHPYFAVSDRSGNFEITGLPAGTYELEAWHEKAGTKTASVTLADGASQSVSFSFSK